MTLLELSEPRRSALWSGLRRLALWAPLPFLLGAGAAAQAQDTRALYDRIQRMERDLSMLQQQVYGGRGGGAGVGDPEAAAAATVRLSQIESELRGTTGQLEETNFAVGQLRQRLDRLVTDMDFRLGELEKIASGAAPAPAARAGAPAAPAAASPAGRVPPGPTDTAAPDSRPDGPPLAGPGAPPRALGAIPLSEDRPPPGAIPYPAPVPQPGAIPGAAPGPVAIAPPAQTAAIAAPPPGSVRLPAGSAKDQYDYAFDLLKRAEYAAAEQALRQFVTNHPTDPLAGNAQYWLAETYYVRNNYSEAAAQFLKGYQTYPQGPKAADNLFKLGLTLTNLGKVQDACTAFQRFDREYASAPGALKRRVAEERQRLACG